MSESRQRIFIGLLVLITITISGYWYLLSTNPFLFDGRQEVCIYVLAGQSNMAGRGRLTKEDLIPEEKIYTIGPHLLWEKAKHPLHSDRPQAGFGLGIPFAKTVLAQTESCNKIILLPLAVGNSSIVDWQKGQLLYNRVIQLGQYASQFGILKGILWHQGESDSRKDRQSILEKYKTLLSEAIQDFRLGLGESRLPIVVGSLGVYLEGDSTYQNSKIINESIRDVVSTLENVGFVDAEELHAMDQVHFDRESLEVLGKRYAVAMLALQ
jgi:hypothetical protein